MDIASLVTQLVALAGVGALIAVLVNIGKSTGLVKDGQATVYVAGGNLVALVALFFLKVFRPDVDVSGLDANAAQVASWLTTLFGLVLSIYGSKLTHNALRGFPVLGRSHTPPARG